MMSLRSSTENSGVFSLLIKIETITWSNNRALRSMMSTCPKVNGSKEPGYIAVVTTYRMPVQHHLAQGIEFVEDRRPREAVVFASSTRRSEGRRATLNSRCQSGPDRLHKGPLVRTADPQTRC